MFYNSRNADSEVLVCFPFGVLCYPKLLIGVRIVSKTLRTAIFKTRVTLPPVCLQSVGYCDVVVVVSVGA